jgi:hypothetical protein
MGKFETLEAEKDVRNSRLLLLAFVAAVLAAYGISAFGIYELVKAII